MLLLDGVAALVLDNGYVLLVHGQRGTIRLLGSDHSLPGRVCVRRASQGTTLLVLFSVSRLQMCIVKVENELYAFLNPTQRFWLLC